MDDANDTPPADLKPASPSHKRGRDADAGDGLDDARAWLDSVPLTEVAPKKQVRACV